MASDGMPGGDEWIDVTELFQNAAEEMDPEDVLLLDGFTLYDAMTAIEIGDARMDTGVILPAQLERPTYVPTARLLPSELCWLLDRSFAAEMQWHKGHTLSQTVFTFLPIYSLDAIHPETIPLTRERDPERPVPLVTVVLRAAVTALMKSVDIAWRKLAEGRVYDTEDWQAEKADVSLGEATPVGTVLARLDFAIAWLRGSAPKDLPWRVEILNRLCLRQALLQLMQLIPTRDPSTLHALLDRARSYLTSILISTPPPEPSPDSNALLAFDPYITRRLNGTMPLQPLPLLPQAEAWSTLDALLTGYSDLHALLHEPSLFAWRLIGDLRHAQSSSRPPIPSFIRALTQSSFFDGYHVLGQTASSSLIDKFFLESLGTSFPYPLLPVHHPPSPARRTLSHIQSYMIKVLSKNVQSGWFNPPRRRRHLGNTLFEWTYLYFATKDFVKLVHEMELDPPLEERQMRLLEAMPLAIAGWRAGSVREIVVSGLGLELYAPQERAAAYWLLREACEAELRVRDDLERLLAPDSLAKRISVARRPVLLAMRSLAHALFLMTLPSFLTVDPTQAALTFHKRHKVYLREEYSRLASRSTWPAELVHPSWERFVQACDDALSDDRGESRDCEENREGDGESGAESSDNNEVVEEGEGGENPGMESEVTGGEGEEGCDNEGEESLEDQESEPWGSAREELQNAADLLAQVDIDSIPFASASPTSASSSSPSTPAPTSSLPWTSDLNRLYTSLRTAAHALAEIAPSSVEEVAEFDAGLLDWMRESMAGGWVPAVRSRDEAGR